VVQRSVDFCGKEHGPAEQFSFLDVGCGVGLTDALLGDRVGTLYGVDAARDAIDVAFAICRLHHVDVTERKVRRWRGVVAAAHGRGIARRRGMARAEVRYIIFSTSQRPSIVASERFLRGIPLGAQHYVAARRVS
jgi:SAM-dependent methyltransferase